MTFRDFVEDLASKSVSIKAGRPFTGNKPNSIAGFVGRRLKGMKSPNGRTGKEVTHHRILKSAFGFDQETTRLIKRINDGSRRKDRFVTLCAAYPEIGSSQFQLKKMPKRWEATYGIKF